MNKQLHRAIMAQRKKKIVFFRSQKGFHFSPKLFWEREKTVMMLRPGNQRLNLEESKGIVLIIGHDLKHL